MIRKFIRLTSVIVFGALIGAVSHLAGAQDQKPNKRESVLLVAAPHMADPHFGRSVVLVMFPPSSGPSGVILNRPTRMTLSDVWSEPEERNGRTDRLYIGGPVEPDGLLFLFRMESAPTRAWHATQDIYFSGDGELLMSILAKTDKANEQRFFAGYSGWAIGQLENEISRGDWYVLQVDPLVVYDTNHEDLWERMYQRATLLRVHRPLFSPDKMARIGP